MEKVACAPYTEIMPIIYMIISVLSDYVLWEDYDVSKMQMDYLYQIIKTKFLDKKVSEATEEETELPSIEVE